MASAIKKFYSQLFLLAIATSILVSSSSAHAVTENLVKEKGSEYLVYSEAGRQVLKIEVQTAAETEKLPPSEEAAFQAKRKSLSEKLVSFFSRKKNLTAGLSVVSQNRIEDLEIKNVTLPVDTAKETKAGLYKKFLAPLISSIYLLGKNEKQVFMKKSELGLSFLIQGYGVAGASTSGGGKLLGIGLDLGFDMKTDRLFVSVYKTVGRFSAAASLPDIGVNLTTGFRSETQPDQSETILDYLLFKRLNISVAKEIKEPTKTTFTGIIPYTVISGEYNERYANMTGGLGMTLNPMPGLAEFDTDTRGYKLYVSNPRVLFQSAFEGMKNLNQTWQRFFSRRAVGLRCHSIY